MVLEERGRWRGSSRDRGYDAHWDRLSIGFRRANPFCRLCGQEGRDAEVARQVDHVLPAIEYPDLKYSWGNLQSLCIYHHSVVKQQMEKYARETGQVKLLSVWCESLDARPRQFRPGGV